MRKTIANLTRGVYDHDAHADLADRGFRRYHPFSFDFDSTSVSLTEAEDHWDEQVKRHALRAKLQERKSSSQRTSKQNTNQFDDGSI